MHKNQFKFHKLLSFWGFVPEPHRRGPLDLHVCAEAGQKSGTIRQPDTRRQVIEIERAFRVSLRIQSVGLTEHSAQIRSPPIAPISSVVQGPVNCCDALPSIFLATACLIYRWLIHRR